MDTIMPVFHPAASFTSRAILAFCIACLGACQKKNEPQPRQESQAAPIEPRAGVPVEAIEPPAEPDPDTVASAEAPADSGQAPHFSSRPPLKAYPGKAWQYRPILSGSAQLLLVQSADSSMKSEKGMITWTPSREGRFPVVIEAVMRNAGGKDGARIRQSFTLAVEKVLSLALKPLPLQAGKGDTLSFDLRGSTYPAWAADRITVRFDYQGDGRWDTEALPMAANVLHRHAYETVGRFAPKVEARYLDLETRYADAAITVISPVMPSLKISPDTVEPGGSVSVDASASKADGALSYSLDLNGDGKPDWRDSLSAKATLKAPASGLYTAVLTARNPMGQEGRAEAVLRVNARPRLDLRVKNPKANMTAQVEFKARAKDVDDSLVKVRFNFTGDSSGWETRTAAPDSQVGPGEWWLRFKHAYGKPGIHSAGFCVTSADGREACQKARVEIFNAPPVCAPGPDLKATVGKPLKIDGSGVDPDGSIVKWEWDLDGDGKSDLVSAAEGGFQYTFSKEGVFALVLKVTSADGVTATGSRKVEVRKKWKG
jgi:hypothetical protein